MDRALSLLRPKLARTSASNPRAKTAFFWWGVTAVVLSFALPENVLQALGLNIFKLMPATYVAVLGGLLALGTMSFHDRIRDAPGLMLFIFMIPVIGLYSAYWQGISGSVVYVETYWIAGLLALMLEPASAKQKRLLAGILMTMCLFNVFVGLYESLTQADLFPLIINPDLDPDRVATEEFRAHGFYGHPLNASLITTMAIYLLYTMRLRFIFAAPIFGLLLVGLLAFGGRTSLGVILIVSALTAFYLLIDGLIRRNLKLDFVLAISFALVVVPILIAVLATQTTIADRIVNNLYYDDSAAVRATQWEILRYLDLRNWLFGIPHSSLDLLKYQIGLGGKDTDIENFWLLMFLNLGAIGFMVYLVVLGAFAVHLGRHSGSMFGWLLIISSMIIDSTSNSLGVRANDLVIEVAFIVAIAGYKGFERVPGVRRSPADRLGVHSNKVPYPTSVRAHTMRG